MDKKDFASFCKLTEIFVLLSHSELSGTALSASWPLSRTGLSKTGRCPGQLWVTLAAVRDSSQCESKGKATVKCRCHSFNYYFLEEVSIFLHRSNFFSSSWGMSNEYFQFNIKDEWKWVLTEDKRGVLSQSLTAVRDSAECKLAAVRDSSEWTGRCPGQLWVKLAAVQDSSEWHWPLSGTALSDLSDTDFSYWLLSSTIINLKA